MAKRGLTAEKASARFARLGCMIKRIRGIAVAVLCAVSVHAELPAYSEITSGLPKVVSGTLHRYKVKSEYLKDDITVDVWTPPAYQPDANEPCPVVYVHDGQNLFDAAFAFANVAWDIDDKVAALVRRGTIETPVVVGISNRGAKNLRANDYFPEQALTYIPSEDRNKTKIFATCAAGFFGDEEAAFVAEELKPLIDRLYHTDTAPSHTFAMGSSMGGLASLYLMCEYPDVFGGAACLSTHWIGSLDLNADYTMNDDPVCATAILAYMDARLPDSDTHKLYLDQGTTGWDAGYLKYEAVARQIAMQHGYSEENASLATYDAQGAGHNEWYWQQRVERPLQFLLDKETLSAETTLTMMLPSDNLYINMLGITYVTDNPCTLPSGVYIHAGRKVMIPCNGQGQ